MLATSELRIDIHDLIVLGPDHFRIAPYMQINSREIG